MGFIGRIILNHRIARLLMIFEEVVQETGSSWPEDREGEGFGFAHLTQTRQAQIRYQLSRGMASLRRYPRHVLSSQILRNADLVTAHGLHVRYLAYVNLYRYLQDQGAVLDLDKYANLYNVQV